MPVTAIKCLGWYLDFPGNEGGTAVLPDEVPSLLRGAGFFSALTT